VALPPGITVRQYEARDREAVRRLCCETGFLGKAIDPVFEDRELFADYLTAYYTDIEPEAAFLLEQNGIVKGYLLGSRRPLRQQFYGFFQNLIPGERCRQLLVERLIFISMCYRRPKVWPELMCS
jgi:hypothetical protein